MAARKRKGTKEQPWPDIVRERIRASMLHNALADHVLGKREMTNSQVRAGLGLLGKVLPDLTENKHEHSGEVTVQVVQFSNNPPPK